MEEFLQVGDWEERNMMKSGRGYSEFYKVLRVLVQLQQGTEPNSEFK